MREIRASVQLLERPTTLTKANEGLPSNNLVRAGQANGEKVRQGGLLTEEGTTTDQLRQGARAQREDLSLADEVRLHGGEDNVFDEFFAQIDAFRASASPASGVKGEAHEATSSQVAAGVENYLREVASEREKFLVSLKGTNTPEIPTPKQLEVQLHQAQMDRQAHTASPLPPPVRTRVETSASPKEKTAAPPTQKVEAYPVRYVPTFTPMARTNLFFVEYKEEPEHIKQRNLEHTRNEKLRALLELEFSGKTSIDIAREFQIERDTLLAWQREFKIYEMELRDSHLRTEAALREGIEMSSFQRPLFAAYPRTTRYAE